jgi:hypothetical protein
MFPIMDHKVSSVFVINYVIKNPEGSTWLIPDSESIPLDLILHFGT